MALVRVSAVAILATILIILQLASAIGAPKHDENEAIIKRYCEAMRYEDIF